LAANTMPRDDVLSAPRGRRRLKICDRIVPAIGVTCVWSVVELVIESLGLVCSENTVPGGSVISVNARAVLPYSNNAHPRILLIVFWSTVFSEFLDTVPCREVRIMQQRDRNNL